MPIEKCWNLLLGTVIWSLCSASSHVQLPKTDGVSHSLLRDPYRVFTSRDRDMIKISQTSICFYFTVLEHAALGKKPQISITLHCFAVLWASSWSWHREEGKPLWVHSLSHTGHSHEDTSEIVLDWALQSSKVQIWIKGGDYAFPPPLSYPEQMKTLYYDNFINSC